MDTVQDFEDILHMLEKHGVFFDIPGTEPRSQMKIPYTKAFQGDDYSVVLNKTWWERNRNRHLPRNGTLPRAAIAFIVPDTSISSTCRANSPNRNYYLGATAANRLFPGQGNFKREITDPSGFGSIDAGKIVPQPIENLTILLHPQRFTVCKRNRQPLPGATPRDSVYNSGCGDESGSWRGAAIAQRDGICFAVKSVFGDGTAAVQTAA